MVLFDSSNVFDWPAGGVGVSLNPFDDTEVASSVLAGATVVLKTYTGKGEATIEMAGDGESQVQIKYSIDGGAFTLINTSDKITSIPVAFNISLSVEAVNTDGGSAHKKATVSQTGVYQ